MALSLRDQHELWNAIDLYAQTFARKETVATGPLRADAVGRVNKIVEELIARTKREGCDHNVCKNGVCMECGRRFL